MKVGALSFPIMRGCEQFFVKVCRSTGAAGTLTTFGSSIGTVLASFDADACRLESVGKQALSTVQYSKASLSLNNSLQAQVFW